MQNSQWLCLIFFLSNLLLSQGYEALHGIPFLKTQIDTSLSAQLIFPIDVEWAFSVLQLGLPTTSFCAFPPPPFTLMAPSWENIFQNKGVMYSFGAVLPLDLWLFLPVLGFHTSTGPCTDTPPALLPAACTAANTETKGSRLSLSLSWWLCTLEGCLTHVEDTCSAQQMQAPMHISSLILITVIQKSPCTSQW